jgi:hypothetical protein
MKAVAVIGDLHCGSVYGLLPPDFESSDERIVGQNRVQKFLWECWLSYWYQVSKYPIEAVVANGDLVDGLGRRVSAGECCLPREADQAAAAQICLQTALGVLKRNVKLYITAGTDYHTGTMAREEESIALGLKSEKYRGDGYGIRIREVLNLSVDGLTGNFAHHVSFAPVNKSMPIEKELQGALLAELDGHPEVDYLIRNHVHYYRSVGAGYRHGATCPCWQLQTKFGRRPGVFRFRPDIGGLVVWVDSVAKQTGDDPIRIQPILYKLPKDTMEVVRL